MERREPYAVISEQRGVLEDRRVGRDFLKCSYEMLNYPEMRRFELHDK